MGSIRKRIETVYAALAFIERNCMEEALPLLGELSRKPAGKTLRADLSAGRARRPGLRAE